MSLLRKVKKLKNATKSPSHQISQKAEIQAVFIGEFW